MPYSLKFPVDINQNKDGFELTEDLLSNAKQNFKMLLLTNPGERLMHPNYGVGIKKFLFENISSKKVIDEDGIEKNLEEVLSNIIADQTTKYQPEIIFESLSIENMDLNTIYIKINYNINGISVDPMVLNFK